MIRRLTLFFLPLSFCLAQEEELEPIEVRGAGPPNILPSLSVFDRQSLDASPSVHLDDLLRENPAFSTYRRSGSGTAHPTSLGVSLRGTGTSAASRSIVLLDGIPLNDPFGGWIRWNRFSPAELEAVRFGPQGAFTSSAGTIKLRSRRPGEKPIRQFRLAGGDVHGFSADGFADTARNEEGWESTGSFRIEDFVGHPVIRASQRGLIDEDAWSRMRTARATVSRSLSFGRLVASFAGFDERRGNGTPLARNEGDGFDWSVRLETEGSLTSVFGQERDFVSIFPKVLADRTSESIALDQFSVPASSLGFVHERSWKTEEHEVGFALATLRREGETNEDAYGKRRVAGGRQTQIGLSFTDTWNPSESWDITVNLRGDWFRDDQGMHKRWQLSDGTVLEDETFHICEDLEFGGSLDFSKAFSETLSAHASVHSHVRQPTLNELYRPYRVGDFSVAANENLGTERITGIECDLHHQVTESFSVSLNLFHDWLRDSVANVSSPTDPNDATRRNLDQAEVDGLELSAEWLLAEDLSLRMHGLLMDAEVRSCPENPEFAGNRFAQVPDRRATATLLWTPAPWELRLDVHHESKRYDDDGNTRQLDDFLALDLSVARKLSENAHLRLAVHNLADEEIQTRLSSDGFVYVGAPKHWTAFLEWQF